jgi:hypothetical protein
MNANVLRENAKMDGEQRNGDDGRKQHGYENMRMRNRYENARRKKRNYI